MDNTPTTPSQDRQPASNTAAKGGTDSIFESLLQKTQEAPESQEENQILSGIIEKKQGDGKILGTTPQRRDLTLLKMMKHRHQLNVGWTILKVVIFLSLVSASYFSYELSPSLTQLDDILNRKNSVNTLTETKEKVIEKQALTNSNNLLAAQLAIDRFAYLADTYIYYKGRIGTLTKDKTKNTQKASFSLEIKKVADEIITNLEFIQSRLKKPFVPSGLNFDDDQAKLDFENSIKSKTQEKIRGLKKLENSDLSKIVDPKTFDGATKLYNNQPLISAFKRINIQGLKENIAAGFSSSSKESEEKEQPNFDKEIKDLAKKVSEVAQNDFSVVSKIRNRRMVWTDFMRIIEDLTKDTDNFYQNKKLRQIFYNSYSFNGKDKKLSVSGITRRLNNYNFTLLANLIDTFEKSPIFSDVNVSALNKSREGDYSTAPIQMDFKIQDGFDPRDLIVSLEEFLADYSVTSDKASPEAQSNESKSSTP